MNLMLDMFDSTDRAPAVDAAISRMAEHCETGRGAIFTRPEVVEAILDLVGYEPDQPLHRKRLLEPSFGAGDFLFVAIERLIEAFVREGGVPAAALAALGNSVRAVELHQESFDQVTRRLCDRLVQWGLSAEDASALCATWLIRDDFLLTPIDGRFDFVVGNPPYVRQERIPAALLSEYRRRFQTLYDRADLYVPFFERGLDLLGEGGLLGYICANRWLKNRYGGPLRDKISHDFWLRYFINLEGVDAFHADVTTYPAITVLQRVPRGTARTRPTRATGGDAATNCPLSFVTDALLGKVNIAGLVEQIRLDAGGSAPLLLDDIPRLALLRRIELAYPTVEEAGCRIGIGVATGCDRVYIDDMDALPVEAERKIPLVMARDLVGGEIRWGGKAVLNPFDESGQLVPLEAFPKFERYLQLHREAVEGRNVAKRNQKGWYRTIDRIQPGLLETPKLLVPDIKGEGVFVIDKGQYYPHHNLYFITSKEWDLRALQTVLRSSFTLMTMATYCTRMAGGFLRFQAQYLRRVRLPRWRDVSEEMRSALIDAASARTQIEMDGPVFELFDLTSEEAKRVREIADSARVGKGLLQ